MTTPEEPPPPPESEAPETSEEDVTVDEVTYRRRLLGMLSVATFFEGYDTFVISLVLPLVLGDLGGTESQAGVIRAIVGVGAVLGFLLAAQADRIGRRRLLLVTIVGYTAATVLTALSPNLAWLTVSQFLAQIFLAGEWAVAITMVVEEWPRDTRGRALGIVTSMNTLGGIFVGILAFLGLQNLGFDWRGFYLVGIVPLVVVGFARRGLRETRRFTDARTLESDRPLNRANIGEPWRPQYRRTLVAVGLLHLFRFSAVSAAAFWWPFYAQREVGMSLGTTGLYLAAAGVVGAGGFVVAGRVMDRWGRRPAFLLYCAGALVFGLALFQTHSPGLMLPFLCLAIFFGLGSAAITSAFATEFFPTYVRGRAAAWCRNAFEIPGGILGSLVVGVLGDHRTGPIGSIGDSMCLLLVVALVPALFLALRHIVETRRADLSRMDELALMEARL
jgi:putative MFS transporter